MRRLMLDKSLAPRKGCEEMTWQEKTITVIWAIVLVGLGIYIATRLVEIF